MDYNLNLETKNNNYRIIKTISYDEKKDNINYSFNDI